MADLPTFAGRMAGIISLLAFVPYWVAIIRQQTKPHRASWWIWTTVGTLLLSSYYASGAKHTIWVPVSYLLGPAVTALLSIRYGEGGWSVMDRICLSLAAISVILWIATGSPTVALLINIFIDVLGGIPTAIHAWKKPEEEDRLAWALFWIGNIVNLFAVESWTWQIALYPIYMFTGCGVIAVFVWRRWIFFAIDQSDPTTV